MIPTTATLRTTWPTTVSALRDLLEIDGGGQIVCHGQSLSKKRRCGQIISKRNIQLISSLLNDVLEHESFSVSESILDRLAHLIMCQRNHQGQAPRRLSSWEKILKPLETVVVKKEEDDIHTIDEADIKEPPKTETVAVKHEVNPKNDESATKTAHRRISQSIPSTPAKTSILSTPPTPHKNSAAKASYFKHEFEDFGDPWTITEINKHMKNAILRPLLDSEKPSDGYIYAYTFPETYRDPDPYIKIGYAQNVDQRMKKWKAKCGYEPKIIVQFTAEHYVKVEKLVHCQLRNQRKREKGCPTCRVSHHEWFKVHSMTASSNIMMWTSWMRQMPYDDEGQLQLKWRKRLESLDMTDPNCWKLFATGVFDEDTDDSELFEEGDSFSWSSDDQSEFSGDDSLEDPDVYESEPCLIKDKKSLGGNGES
ncbi:uncharacterized protein FIESC28_11701 [Fusarium coffeatum]|uniref:Bacteriophage T5 Orf172 DNA-binding domain-containing protein n=1 Tax=Fusarium coffeatum TaxID=231269 RepID=A0A366QFR1_9HYPO|nr:uncharacterized protein FIESC28_11701 [Fusarium coffeatum]RBR03769.1 hypothetical protein FIESC28_11701 [Fusarium coffeatum]